MKFDTATSVEQVVFQMRLADYPRGKNRARINDLFNGAPPYSDAEQEENHIDTNVNDLSATKIDHDARRMFDNAFITPNPLFTLTTDYGPVHKRQKWGMSMTKKINALLIDSEPYLDLRQGVFAGTVLHGIGPSNWEDDYSWCPVELGIEDVLLPSKTLRSLTNLTCFALYKEFTFEKLYRMTHGPKVSKNWQMDTVNAALKWADSEAQQLLSVGWQDVWAPEKMSERLKSDSGLYSNDAVPTINVYDFYFYSDEGKKTGWRRRMILDTWSQGEGPTAPTRRKGMENIKDFLYSSGDDVYRDKRDQIIHFQFGDVSAVAPFRYHSVRSLGFLLYAVCHLQNRLKCKFSDAVFESLLQYFRVNDPSEVDRLQKIDLTHLGIIPEGCNFVRPEERWKVDPQLVTEFMNVNRQTMGDLSSSFTKVDEDADPNESATMTMQKASTSSALIGSMLNRAYAYERFRYKEICRRFAMNNSKDKDVMAFRLHCLKDGIPEDLLNDSERWNIEPNKAVGTGNKQLAVAVTNELFAMRPVLDPTAQKTVDRMKIAVITEDYDLAQRLVPEQPGVSDSVHDTELVFGTLMQGVPVTPKPGLNAAEVAETIIRLMATRIQQIAQATGMGTPEDLQGLQLCGQYASSYIQQLGQDKNSLPLAKQLNDAMGNLNNMLKAFAQRQQEAQQEAQQQGQDLDPETQSKIQANIITAQTKAKIATESHAQKTAQRQVQFEHQTQQSAAKTALELSTKAAHANLDLAVQKEKAAIELSKAKAKPKAAPKKAKND